MRTVGGHAAPQQPCSSRSHCASASSAVDLSRLGALQQRQPALQQHLSCLWMF